MIAGLLEGGAAAAHGPWFLLGWVIVLGVPVLAVQAGMIALVARARLRDVNVPGSVLYRAALARWRGCVKYSV